MTRGVKRFTDLRAWQACDVFKKAIYRLCENKPIADALGRRKQLKESSSHTTVHIAEGFGRFNPADFAKFCTIARSSLMESQNHLLDFVNKRYISEEGRLEPGRSHNESRTERRTEQRTLSRTMKLNTNREARRQKSERS